VDNRNQYLGEGQVTWSGDGSGDRSGDGSGDGSGDRSGGMSCDLEKRGMDRKMKNRLWIVTAGLCDSFVQQSIVLIMGQNRWLEQWTYARMWA